MGEGRAGRGETGGLRFLAGSWRAAGVEERKIAARLRRRGFGGAAVRAACREEDTSW